MNKIKRAIMRVIVYLALGFVISWLIAWAIAFVPHRFSAGRYSFSQYSSARPNIRERETYFIYDSRWLGAWEMQYSTQRAIRQSIKRGAPGPPTQLWWAWQPFAPSPTPTLTYLDLKNQYQGLEIIEEPRAGPTNELFYSVIKYGWPALSHRVQGAYSKGNPNADNSMPSVVQGAFSMPVTENAGLSRFTIYPYQPIWTGLTINTVLYALIIAMLHSIKRAYRHARRMRKGRCPMCSYDLGFVFVDGCSECGWRKV